MKLLYLLLFVSLQLPAQKTVKKTTAVPQSNKQKDEMPALNFGIEKQLKALAKETSVAGHPVIKTLINLTEQQKRRVKKVDSLTGNFKACLQRKEKDIKQTCKLSFEQSDLSKIAEHPPMESLWGKEKISFLSFAEKATDAKVYIYAGKDGITGFSIAAGFENFLIARFIMLQNDQPVFMYEEHASIFDEVPYRSFFYFDKGELFYEEKTGTKRFTPDKSFNDVKQEFKNELSSLIDAVKKEYNQ